MTIVSESAHGTDLILFPCVFFIVDVAGKTVLKLQKFHRKKILTIEMFILANFVHKKMSFEQSQFEKLDKTFPEFYLLISSSLWVPEESSFQASKCSFKNTETVSEFPPYTDQVLFICVLLIVCIKKKLF